MNASIEKAINNGTLSHVRLASKLVGAAGLIGIHGWKEDVILTGEGLIDHAIKVTGEADESVAVANYINNFAADEIHAAYPDPITY